MISFTGLSLVLLILLIHWVADFVCQSDWQAKNKSTSIKALLSHTLTYSGVWLIMSYFSAWMAVPDGIIPDFMLKAIWRFVVITFVAHSITDFITSRITKRLFEKKDIHNFFVVIGFDQWLHYFQLLLTYFWVTQNIIYV